MSQTIAVIRGDGIGPEIMEATLHVLEGLKLGLDYDFVDAGLSAYEKTGELLPAATLEAIHKHRIALKSPLTTPVGEGFSSINVELRKRFDLYANVRPAISFPNTKSRYENIDLITVRENTEGAYIGEGQALSADGETATLTQRVTRRGSERIVRYAFDMARRIGRKKVTVVHKANILKSTSGLFLKVAREVAAVHDRLPAVDPDDAADVVRRGQARKATFVPLGPARQRTGLLKCAGVRQQFDPVAHREFAATAMFRHGLGAAHLPRKFDTAAQFIDFGLP